MIRAFMLFIFLFNFVLLSVSPPAYAEKVNVEQVEQTVMQKLDAALSVMLPKKYYTLNVSVEKEVIQPVAKADPTKPEDKKDEAKKELPKKDVIVTDAKEPNENYILFHKLGLEAPIEFAKEEKIEKKEVVEKEKEEINERIKSIEVSVILDNKLPKNDQTMVKTMLSKMKFSFSVQPSIAFSTAKLRNEIEETEAKKLAKEAEAKEAEIEKRNEAKAKKEKEELEKKAQSDKANEKLELISKFASSAGFVLASIIFSLVAFLLFGKYAKLQTAQTAALMESKSSSKSDGESATPASVAAAAQAPTADPGSGPSYNSGRPNNSSSDAPSDIKISVERFKGYMAKSEKDAASLIKKWVNSGTDGAAEALLLLAQQLEPEVLVKMFNHLTYEDRRKWKGLIGANANALNPSVGASFIDEQILSEIIVPTDLIGEDTKTLLYGIDPNSAAQLINENSDLGPLLMNTLSSAYIVKMMPRLKPELIEQLTLGSIEIDKGSLKGLEAQLQEKLKKYQVGEAGAPFTEKISEILPFVSVNLEEPLLKAYSKKASYDQVMAVLKRFVPGQAIAEFPDNVSKSLLSVYPQKSLVELLIVQDEAVGKKNLDIVAPAGSKRRDMLDLEIAEVKKDEVLVKKLTKNKKDIEGAYIKYVRDAVAKSPALQNEVEPILEQFCAKYTGKTGGGEGQSSAA